MMSSTLLMDGKAVTATIRQTSGTEEWIVDIDGEEVNIKGKMQPGVFPLFIGARRLECAAIAEKNGVWIWIDGRSRLVSFEEPDDNSTGETTGSDRAPMPSVVVAIKVELGQTVSAGDDLAVVSAMKMEMVLKATENGVVSQIVSAVGETVDAGERVVIVNGESNSEANNE
jgi:acetyl/propionyl-CoA carboxylase alpha subunit